MKKIVMPFLALSMLLGGSLSANILGGRDAASRYYNREISADAYVDSLIGPMNQHHSYYGEISPNQFGGGYNYADTYGSQMEVRPNGFGGWDVKGYGY